MKQPETLWDAVVDALQQAKRIAITCHRQPDGDALGASLAAGLALRSLGKEVQILLPTAAGRQYGFLPGLAENDDLATEAFDGMDDDWCEVIGHAERAQKLPAFDVLLVLDVDVGERLLAVQHVARKQTLVIDHHASSTARAGDVTIIAPESPCTGMLVEHLLDRLQVPLTPDLATCLYTALSFDTGRFMHSNTTPAVFRPRRAIKRLGARWHR